MTETFRGLPGPPGKAKRGPPGLKGDKGEAGIFVVIKKIFDSLVTLHTVQEIMGKMECLAHQVYQGHRGFLDQKALMGLRAQKVKRVNMEQRA